MDELLKYLGLFALATPVAYGLIKYFSKSIFETYLTKSIETHKSNLERINISHEIQYASLHKERAIVIRELYDKLFNYKMAVIHFFNVELAAGHEEADLKSRITSWSNIVPDFSSYFHRNRLYLSKDLCSIIDNLNNELDKINKDTQSFLQSFKLVDKQIQAIKSKDKGFTDLRDNVNGFLEKDIEKITNDLEKEFRKILGVE
ncbi:hypothetical protein GCM10009119_16740 [Algoriphagus jejuensis]|uniref:Uncharacterized protein n=1 Tax=Algoriphagus jejuensis TaxID=419934 RepID=A0ABN1MZK1_9BACT